MITSFALVLMGAMAATPCENLKTVELKQATITAADFVPEGPAPARGGGGGARGARGGAARGGAPAAPAAPAQPPAMIPAHCRVQMVLKPTTDSLINMELWLPPAEKWNGKFMGV